MISRNLPAFIPMLFLGAALLIPLLGKLRKETAYYIAAALSLFVAVISLYGLFYVLENGTIRYFFGGWVPPIGIEFYYDPLAALISLLINTVSFVVILYSKESVDKELSFRMIPYYSIAMLLLCGLNGIVLTGDLFNLFVFIEITSLAGYALIAVGEKKAPFAAFRYLIMGTIGGSFYLLGIGFLYIMTGTLNIVEMSVILPVINTNPTILIALVLIVSGLGIKTAIFPMHGWLPDSYTYAPSVSSALIAPIGTKVGAYVLIRILFFMFGAEYFAIQFPIADILAFFSAVGIIFGSLWAMAQKELKRMLAYSSIAQIGYIGLGIGLANPLGFAGAILHLINHAFMKGALFLVAGNLRYKNGHSDISLFDDSYRKKYPWTMASFTVAALSMIGLPPLAGFFSKWYLVLATVQNRAWLYLAVILISSLLNAFYFFRILEKVYLRKADVEKDKTRIEEDEKYDEPKFSLLFPVLILAAALILLGLFNAYIFEAIFLMYPGM
jgi:multicomponent Na+:H+ antiporter subunit D